MFTRPVDLKHLVRSCYTLIDDPVVELTGLRDLRTYLDEHVLTFKSCRILGFRLYYDEIYVYIDVKINENEFVRRRAFYGYLNEVARRIQEGFYEPPVD